jgi:hypothetical protein
MPRYIWLHFFFVWCWELISSEAGAMIGPLSVFWMIHEWIWIIARVMIDRAKYTTPMKTCSCHSYTTNPTCRLFSREGTWTSIVRGRWIIAWEALGIIRFLWSSPHPIKDRLPFAGRNMTLKLKVCFKIRLLLWFILATSFRIPEGETTKVSLNWIVVFYFIHNTKKNKKIKSKLLFQYTSAFFFFSLCKWNSQLLFHSSL